MYASVSYSFGYKTGMYFSKLLQISRIYHRSDADREIQPEGELIMPETRFTEFPTLSIDPRVGISRSAWETKV